MTNIHRNPSVQLSLDGKPIYLYKINMSISMKRDDKDMSGQKSSTKHTDKGIKAKEINVSGIIPYNRKEWLANLFKLAEAENEKGEQATYRISSMSANAINMREVRFSDGISASEDDGQMAWQVSFLLREVNSISEKKEARRKKPAIKIQNESAPVAYPTHSNEDESTKQKSQNSPPLEKKKSPDEILGTEQDDSFWGKINNGKFSEAFESKKTDKK
ncbi:hypothetical protein ACNO7P_11035 [Bisgaard Taxon 45]